MAEAKKMIENDQLPEEMIIEIAQRLPPKSIPQFKLVSKPWKSLLSCRNFIKSHLHHQLRRAPERFIVIDKSNNTPHVVIPATSTATGSCTAVPFRRSIRAHQEVQVLGFCNGLVLLNLVNFKPGEHCLFVMNPTTKRSTHVFLHKNSEEVQNKFGLGYDESEDDYKIIALMYPVRTNSAVNVVKTKMQIYSLKTRTKRLINFPRLHFEWEPIVYADGYLYWLAFKGKYANLIIVAFNLSTLEIHEVPRPAVFGVDQMKLSSFGCEVAVLGGRFALVDRSCPIRHY